MQDGSLYDTTFSILLKTVSNLLLFCLVYLLSLSFPSGHLSVFISDALNKILLLSMHNICSHSSVLSFDIL